MQIEYNEASFFCLDAAFIIQRFYFQYLDQQLKYAQKNKFGDKRQNARNDEKRGEDAADREDEKDKFDGTEGSVSAKSVQESPAEGNPVKEK